MSDDGRADGTYREDDLLARIQRALESAGVDPENPTRADLARFEEFHLGGRAPTCTLAELADLAGDHVLDVGCGIGGPARTLAAEYDCRVVGLDRVAAYPRVAAWLSARVGLSDETAFVRGDATALPVADESFDAAWLQHAGMNVAATDRLLDELFRVVRPGGTLALHEVCAGSRGSPRFPVPWATDASWSHLLAPAELAEVVTDAGFEQRLWSDVTDESLARVCGAIDARERGSVSATVVDLLVEGNADDVFANLEANLAEDRIAVVTGVFRRPPVDG